MKKYVLPIFILILGVVLNYFSTMYVNSIDDHDVSYDLMHSFVPFDKIYGIIGELTLIIVVILFFYGAIKNKYSEWNVLILALGIIYILRALILPLTPLSNPYPVGEAFGFIPFLLHGGTIFSGHTAFVFVMYLYSKSFGNIRFAILGFTLITALMMIISRGHYTIDVVMGVMVAYLIFSNVDKFYVKKLEKSL